MPTRPESSASHRPSEEAGGWPGCRPGASGQNWSTLPIRVIGGGYLGGRGTRQDTACDSLPDTSTASRAPSPLPQM